MFSLDNSRSIMNSSFFNYSNIGSEPDSHSFLSDISKQCETNTQNRQISRIPNYFIDLKEDNDNINKDINLNDNKDEEKNENNIKDNDIKDNEEKKENESDNKDIDKKDKNNELDNIEHKDNDYKASEEKGCKTNTVKKEEINNKNEIIKEDNKSQNNEDFVEKTIIKVIKILIKRIEEDKKIDEFTLFNIIDFLIPSYLEVMSKGIKKCDNLSANELNDLVCILSIKDLLEKIKEIKQKQINEDTMSESEISHLKVELISYEKSNGNNNIINEIKAEAGDNPEPIEKLDIVIKIFIKHCLEKYLIYLMMFHEENIEIKPEIE